MDYFQIVRHKPEYNNLESLHATKKNNEHIQNHNYGISLLRFMMCFEVILLHFWKTNTDITILKPFFLLEDAAVPTFMILSFFLSENKLHSFTISKFKKRIYRLVWPQLVWTLIYWGGYYCLNAVGLIDKDVTVIDGIWQLFTGHRAILNASMWYQIVIIILTCLEYAIFEIKNSKIIIYLLGTITIISFILQYSGINYSLFNNARYELKYPLGRLIEMIPYMAVGLLIAHYRILDVISRKALYLGVVILLVLAVLSYRLPNVKGFGYSGITKLLVAMAVLSVMYTIPFDHLPNMLLQIIKVVSKFTLGIYCSHRFVATILGKIFIGSMIQVDTFVGCILIYVSSYFISLAIYLIPHKLARMSVD